MVVKQILLVAQRWGSSLSHLGKLGKEATVQSFLIREKRKLVLKLGERTLELMRAETIQSTELVRWVAQIDKIDQVLQRRDYGGEQGRTFIADHPEPKKKTRPRKK